MKAVTKIWFNVGPYEGLIGYLTKKEALSNKIAGETLVGIELNGKQIKTLTSAYNNAFTQQ